MIKPDLGSPCCPDEQGVQELMDITEFWIEPEAGEGDGPPNFTEFRDRTDESDHNSYACRECGNTLLWDRKEHKFVTDEPAPGKDLNDTARYEL